MEIPLAPKREDSYWYLVFFVQRRIGDNRKRSLQSSNADQKSLSVSIAI